MKKRLLAVLLCLMLLAQAMVSLAMAEDMIEIEVEQQEPAYGAGEDDGIEAILSDSSEEVEEVVEEVEATDLLTEELVESEESNAEPTLAGEGDVPIDAAHFPDEAFRDFVEWCDDDEDGALSAAERGSVTEIDVRFEDIKNLTGIEQFPNLTALYCDYNELTSLDVSKCPALETLWCYNNQLTSLDVSKCAALYELSCYGNQLTSLDVSGCPLIIKAVEGAEVAGY